jgi:hypothetical protein
MATGTEFLGFTAKAELGENALPATVFAVEISVHRLVICLEEI